MLLVLGLIAVVAMAFRVSWNALRDVARAVGADHTAAVLYPIVVDGLMALALVATLVLTGRDKRFALRVLAAYVTASLVLNYDHGLVSAIQSGDRVRLADWAPANWLLMLLATSLPVGSIYFGSDLVAKVLHHKSTSEERADTGPDWSMPEQPLADAEPSAESVYLPADTVPVAMTPAAKPATDLPTVDAASRPRLVPDLARTTTRPKRSTADLIEQARTTTADWPQVHITGERLRKELATSAANGRMLRDLLLSERLAKSSGLASAQTKPSGTELHVAEDDDVTDNGAGDPPATTEN